ncbi:MAG: hypothetical protein UY92_C0004G0062 [Candidatus Magasanikbacteria bacterium GW2011_GWA2_56_11]|uniref:Uncharacterized protein n=1 Tax=Candidatus Magasanikbacteria bacterium GW2011_GWA2_56_11 TaxID=1619044 RepID=A0A0G1YHL8_9BACT|nr:MAG: hypothetical protein UY92_C0004G0062 [Candidatus Magasanikbacteria bacterium GW2011_GWA2_56_11]
MKYLYSFLLAVLGLAPGILSAAGIQSSGPNLSTVAKKAEFSENVLLPEIVGTVINAVLSLVGLIFLVLMVYAGILWMTARGDESKVEKAKTIIEASLIGLFITVSAYAITVFLTGRFETAP